MRYTVHEAVLLEIPMQVTLIYRDAAHSATWRSLDRGKPATFGKGRRADFAISGSQVADMHFSIEHDGRVVRLRNLAPKMAAVLVNEQPVAEVDLQDGDVVQVGNTQVGVQIKGSPAPAGVTEDLGPPAISVGVRELPTGLLAYDDPSGQTALDSVFTKLAASFQPLLLANFLAAGQPLPSWLDEQDDLLGAVPREQSGSKCLYLVGPDDMPPTTEEGVDSTTGASGDRVEALFDLFHSLRAHGAGVVLFGEGDKPQVLRAIGFRRGFYASAPGLAMFLKQGSRELAGGLIEAFHAILIAGADDRAWTLYANPALAPTADALGLAPQP